MARSPYDTLGVSRTATEAEIASAYRKLAKQNHPDLNPGDKKAEDRFKAISSAYDILGDKEKRARYDRGELDEQGRERGFAGAGYGGGRGGSRRGPQGARYEFRTGPSGAGGFAFDDIISELFGGQRGGGSRGFSPGSVSGDDTRLSIEIDFLDAARGGVKRVALPSGEALDINIPAGIESGKTLRLKGKGAPSPAGGQPGDALVEVRVREDARFRRDGLDITVDQNVPLETAILGGKVRVPTIEGEVSLSIPPGSSSGRLLRLRGKGIRDAKGSKAGDQIVRLLVDVPSEDPGLEAWARKRVAISA